MQATTTSPTAPPEGLGPGQRTDAAVRELLDRLGDKRKVTVICRLDGGPLRFNELRRAADGITQRLLSATVRRLERDGLLTRTVLPTVPPSVQYALTDSGSSLREVLYQLVEWTGRNLEVVAAARERYDARGEPIR
jgi:DNA-binding HxlR family transcriptional regulator